MKIVFQKLTSNARIPSYAHPTDSGMDISSCEDVSILPRSHAKIQTGIRCKLPDGYELQVRPRSGLSSRGVVAMWGTVDTDYRGEIGVVLYNMTDEIYTVNIGDRISQLVIAPVCHADIEEGVVEVDTDRGGFGFGSTGL